MQLLVGGRRRHLSQQELNGPKCLGSLVEAKLVVAVIMALKFGLVSCENDFA